ncbi:MAG: hypothetical protein PHQ98_00495 [Candidatus ainarchaeum sp.]|nr:hypothetical protein [Candidatus ainarchaeum sp.]
MKAIFEVKTINAPWKPPFDKVITTETYTVDENESFDRITGNGFDEPVFTFVQSIGQMAIVVYSKTFTLKGLNPSNRRIQLSNGEEMALTYLWGENGITKKITFKGFTYSDATNDSNENNSSEINSNETEVNKSVNSEQDLNQNIEEDNENNNYKNIDNETMIM